MKTISVTALIMWIFLLIIAGTDAYANILVVVQIDQMLPASGSVPVGDSCGATASIHSLTINDYGTPDKTELDAEFGISYLSWEVVFAGGGGTIDTPVELLTSNPTSPDHRPNPKEGDSISPTGKFSSAGQRIIWITGIVYVYKSGDPDYLNSGNSTAFAVFTVTE